MSGRERGGGGGMVRERRKEEVTREEVMNVHTIPNRERVFLSRSSTNGSTDQLVTNTSVTHTHSSLGSSYIVSHNVLLADT